MEAMVCIYLHNQSSLLDCSRCLQIFTIIIKDLEKLFSHKYFFTLQPYIPQILRSRNA